MSDVLPMGVLTGAGLKMLRVIDQYHPDNLCDPCSPRYDPKYREIARRPTSGEVLQAFRYAGELGLRFESLSYEKSTTGLGR